MLNCFARVRTQKQRSVREIWGGSKSDFVPGALESRPTMMTTTAATFSKTKTVPKYHRKKKKGACVCDPAKAMIKKPWNQTQVLRDKTRSHDASAPPGRAQISCAFCWQPSKWYMAPRDFGKRVNLGSLFLNIKVLLFFCLLLAHLA